MRFPITFKLGVGFLFSGWALNIFLNTQLAINYYKSMAASSVTTAFAAALSKASPALYQIEGFSNYYSWTPIFICLASGFILSAIFCSIFEVVGTGVFLLAKLIIKKLPDVLDALTELRVNLKKANQSEKMKVLGNFCKSSVEAIADTIPSALALNTAALLLSFVVVAHYITRNFPVLTERVVGMYMELWFTPNHGVEFIINSVLGSLFNW